MTLRLHQSWRHEAGLVIIAEVNRSYTEDNQHGKKKYIFHIFILLFTSLTRQTRMNWMTCEWMTWIKARIIELTLVNSWMNEPVGWGVFFLKHLLIDCLGLGNLILYSSRQINTRQSFSETFKYFWEKIGPSNVFIHLVYWRMDLFDQWFHNSGLLIIRPQELCIFCVVQLKQHY